ncbi:MAG: hypothetical protein ACE5HV_18000 [Acidobacteriota bacterium]
MSRRPSYFGLLLLLVALHPGCGSEGEGRPSRGPSGPVLFAVDSIRLLEADTADTIGYPRAPVFDPFDGTFYVSDTYWKRVLRFDRGGRLLRVYGRPGAGPGEFGFNALVFVLDDSTVVVVDERANRLKFFDRQRGTYRRERVFYPHGQTLSGSTVPVRIGDELWFPWVDPMERKALARWSLQEDSIQWLGAMPSDYHASRDGPVQSYANHMLIGSLTGTGRGLVRGWYPSNELFLYDLAGTVTDSVQVPALRRRGTPDNLRYRYDVELIRDRLTINSVLSQLGTLPDGGIAITYHDQEIVSTEGPLPALAAHVWLGVISPDLNRACVDTRVPASLDAMAAEAFRGDTLFVLDRRIVEDTRLETWLVLYRIETRSCDWIPLRRR